MGANSLYFFEPILNKIEKQGNRRGHRIPKERRLYIKPEEAEMYRRRGITVYEGLEGGLFVDKDELKRKGFSERGISAESKVSFSETYEKITQALGSKMIRLCRYYEVVYDMYRSKLGEVRVVDEYVFDKSEYAHYYDKENWKRMLERVGHEVDFDKYIEEAKELLNNVRKELGEGFESFIQGLSDGEFDVEAIKKMLSSDNAKEIFGEDFIIKVMEELNDLNTLSISTTGHMLHKIFNNGLKIYDRIREKYGVEVMHVGEYFYDEDRLGEYYYDFYMHLTSPEKLAKFEVMMDFLSSRLSSVIVKYDDTVVGAAMQMEGKDTIVLIGAFNFDPDIAFPAVVHEYTHAISLPILTMGVYGRIVDRVGDMGSYNIGNIMKIYEDLFEKQFLGKYYDRYDEWKERKTKELEEKGEFRRPTFAEFLKEEVIPPELWNEIEEYNREYFEEWKKTFEELLEDIKETGGENTVKKARKYGFTFARFYMSDYIEFITSTAQIYTVAGREALEDMFGKDRADKIIKLCNKSREISKKLGKVLGEEIWKSLILKMLMIRQSSGY